MDLDKIVKEICRVAEDAGRFIDNQTEQFSSEMVRSKAYHDLVSYVDTEAEEIVVSGLKNILPGASFYTEEETAARGSGEFTWYVDPLDGTTNFIHGVAPYSVSIALCHNNDVVAGVVYDIPAKEMFHAVKGGGAYMNGKQIRVSGSPTVDKSLIATGFPVRKFERLKEYMLSLEFLIRNSHGVRRMGSASVDLAHVASGKYDAFYEYGLNPWDIMAGMIIVREAGGKVTDFSGSESGVNGDEIIASNALISNEVINIVRGFMKI